MLTWIITCGNINEQNGSNCIAKNWSWLLVAFFRPKIIIVKYGVLHSPVKYEISSSLPGGPDDPSRVLCWPTISVSLDWCWVRTTPPPTLQYRQWVAYLNWLFGAKPSVSQNAGTWACDWLNWFLPIIIFIVFNIFSHLQASPGARVCSSFFLSVVFFSGELPFALYSVRLRAVVQLSLLSRCFVRVALLFGPLTPAWLIWVVVGQSL